MTNAEGWEVNDWRELDVGEDDTDSAIAKFWNRQFQQSVESWAIIGNPNTDDSDELLYQVLYTEKKISISVKDVLLNLSDVDISFKNGLSVMVPSSCQVHLDGDNIITSFDDKESAENYVRERIS
jgi:hypothetical protein